MARGQHFLERSDDEVRAFLLNHSVDPEQAQEAAERVAAQRRWGRGGASVGLILGGLLLALISAVLIGGAQQQGSMPLIGMGIAGIAAAIGCEISGIIGLAGLLKR